MLEYILEFLGITGISEAAFGAMVLNDVTALAKLRAGRQLNDDARNCVMLFIQDYDDWKEYP